MRCPAAVLPARRLPPPAAAGCSSFGNGSAHGSAHCLPCRTVATVSKQLVKHGLVLERKWAKGGPAHKRDWQAMRLSAACNLANAAVSVTFHNTDATPAASALRCIDLVLGPCRSVLQDPPDREIVVGTLLNSAACLLKTSLMLADAHKLGARLAELVPPNTLVAFLAAATDAGFDAGVASGALLNWAPIFPPAMSSAASTCSASTD